jgi:membrane protein DedA with SNARE-associated domain
MENIATIIKTTKAVIGSIANGLFTILCGFAFVWVCAFDPNQFGKWLGIASVVVAIGAILWFCFGVKDKWLNMK